jgi:hypothetical protein
MKDKGCKPDNGLAGQRVGGDAPGKWGKYVFTDLKKLGHKPHEGLDTKTG